MQWADVNRLRYRSREARFRRAPLRRNAKNYLLGQPAHQYNLKLDYLLDDHNRFGERFSKGYLRWQSPTDFQGAIGQGDEHNDYYNGVLDYTWTASPTLTWLNRVSIDRHHQTRFPDSNISPTTVGFPNILETGNGSEVFPQINVQNFQSLGLTGYTQTIEAQTGWVIDSSVSKIAGPHNPREFFNMLDRANRYAILWRVQTAKKQETRAKKMVQFIGVLERGDKIHRSR